MQDWQQVESSSYFKNIVINDPRDVFNPYDFANYDYAKLKWSIEPCRFLMYSEDIILSLPNVKLFITISSTCMALVQFCTLSHLLKKGGRSNTERMIIFGSTVFLRRLRNEEIIMYNDPPSSQHIHTSQTIKKPSSCALKPYAVFEEAKHMLVNRLYLLSQTKA